MMQALTSWLLLAVACQAADVESVTEIAGAADPKAIAAAEEFWNAIEEAQQQVEEALADAIEKAGQRRAASAEERLEGVKELERQKEQFEADGAVPEHPLLKGAATRYTRAHDQATARLDRTFKPLIAAHLDAGEEAEAAMLTELRNVLVVGPGHELVGTWQLREGRGSHGYRERFEIEKKYGRWSLRRTFVDDRGRIVGEGRGTDFSIESQTLRYLDNWQRKPVETWDDNCTFTIRPSEDFDGLHVHWQAPNGVSGVISLVRKE